MTAPRTPLWQTIAQTLQEDIAAGRYAAGDKLPTEAELALRFGVNRHTVRHALANLAQAGLVHARRGAGVFVTIRPTSYALGTRVRFHQNILESGRSPSRQITRLETCPASAKEAAALGLGPGDAVHVIEGISLADGLPIAAFRSCFPAARFPDLLAHMAGQTSVSAALAVCGLPDYTRAETRITAKPATALLALALHLREGAPVIRTRAINIAPDGQAVEYGTTWFAGDRVTLTVQNPDAARDLRHKTVTRPR